MRWTLGYYLMKGEPEGRQVARAVVADPAEGRASLERSAVISEDEVLQKDQQKTVGAASRIDDVRNEKEDGDEELVELLLDSEEDEEEVRGHKSSRRTTTLSVRTRLAARWRMVTQNPTLVKVASSVQNCKACPANSDLMA